MGAINLDLEELHRELKRHPRASEMGMIASHRGLVRSTSRQGRPVSGLTIRFDHQAVQKVLDSIRSRPGIVEVLARFNEGELKVGDDVMVVVVAGDIREHVFPALVDAVEQIKKSGARKVEHFIGE